MKIHSYIQAMKTLQKLSQSAFSKLRKVTKDLQQLGERLYKENG